MVGGITGTVEIIRLPCGVCGELLARQVRAHAVDVTMLHPCTYNRMRNVQTEYARTDAGWRSKGTPVIL